MVDDGKFAHDELVRVGNRDIGINYTKGKRNFWEVRGSFDPPRTPCLGP